MSRGKSRGGSGVTFYAVGFVLGGLFLAQQHNAEADTPLRGCVTRLPAGTAGLDRTQLRNAGTILSVGMSENVGPRGRRIALMAAMTEANLRNPSYGDRDSVGAFQQRAAWGSTAKRMNVAESARMFYTGGQRSQPGLLDVQAASMSTGAAAQEVQRSAYPDRYATHEAMARKVVAAAKTTCKPKGA